MAHEIDMSNEQANMAYVGDTPWHGLGQKLEPNANLSVWAKAAGLDYQLATVKAANGGISVPGKKIIYRADTRQGLAVVSDKYKIVQPLEVLQFFERYVQGTAQLETAGVLFGGRRYWALARLEGEIDIAGDITRPYLMLSSSCDGSGTTQARLTSVRVVCNNTLEMATAAKADVSVRHNQAFDADRMAGNLEGIYQSIKSHTEMLKALAATKLSTQQATEVLGKLYDVDPSRLQRTSSRVLELFNGAGKGAELESSKNTAYGLLQAITQYSDWEMGKHQDNRLLSSWFGYASKFKTQATNELMSLVA